MATSLVLNSRKKLKIASKYSLLLSLLVFIISCTNKGNKIIVETKDSLKVKNVEIKYGFVSLNRENDAELFSTKLTSVFDGKEKNNLSTNFGENDFLVVYDKSYYYSFRHFIPSDFKNDYPTGHDYKFLLYKRNDTIFCDVDVRGEKPMKFTRFMSDIESAENRLGNTAKEKAGTIFNMKEIEEK